MNYTYFVELGNWFFISFILSVTLGAVVESVLWWLDSEKGHLKAKVSRLHRLCAAARKTLPYRKVVKALEYKRVSEGFEGMVETAHSAVSTLAVLFGAMPFLVALFRHTLPSLPAVWCWILASLCAMVGKQAMTAPSELYEDFNIEGRYGFNRKTVRTFVLDRLKGLAFGSAVLVASTLAMDWALRRFFGGGMWNIIAFVAFGMAIVKLCEWLYLNAIMPSFNSFKPLKKGPLRKKLLALCSRCGMAHAKIEVMDASKRSSHPNAFICGSFGKKRIVLFDTMLKALTDDEIVAVVAHEIGHGRLHHLLLKNVLSVVTLTAFTAAAFALMATPSFYHAFGYSFVTGANLPDFYIVGLGLSASFIGAFSWIAEPLGNWLSRAMERAADRYAARAIKRKAALAEALVKLTAENLADAFPHPAYEFASCTHPSIVNRVEEVLKA